MDRDPLRPGRPRTRLRRGGFATVELDVAGWGALAGAGLVLGGVVTWATGVDPASALLGGVLAAWAGALLADHLRWRNATIGIGRGDLDAATGAVVVARLRELGVDAHYEERRYDDEDEPQRSIVCRNPDARTVGRVLDETLGRG